MEEITMKEMPVTIEALELYTELDEKGAETYYRARQRKGLLEREFTGKFSAKVKEKPGFSDESPPAEETFESVKVGDIAFRVKATPSTKRPGYEEVFNYTKEVLQEALRNYQNDVRAAGIMTIEGRPYIALDTIRGKIHGKRDEVTQSGVKLEIAEIDIPKALASEEVLGLALDIGNGIAELTPGNAANYIRAQKLLDGYSGIIKDFESGLVEMTGYSNSNPPDETKHMYQSFGMHVFHVPTVPYPAPSYGQMVSRLVKETQRNTRTTGDLVLIERNSERPELEVYAARTRGGKKYVSIQGMLERMDAIQDLYTDTKIRQKPINHYPLV